MTRAKIVEIAAAQFAANGYGLTRLNDIADVAGIHLSALYYHFDTKEALASEVLTKVPREAASALHRALAELPPSARHRDRISAAIRVYLAHILRQDFYTRASLQIAQQAPKEVREQALTITREESEILKMLLEAARADGALRKDLDMTMARMILFGAMNWAIEWFRPEGHTADEFADEVIKVIFDGIAPRNEPESG